MLWSDANCFQIVLVLVPDPATTPAGPNIFNCRADLICHLVNTIYQTILALYCSTIALLLVLYILAGPVPAFIRTIWSHRGPREVLHSILYATW